MAKVAPGVELEETTPHLPALEELTLDSMNRLLWANALGLRAQELTPAVANATATTVGTILRGTKLQMDYHRMRNEAPSIPLLEA
jgi:hypothetical protein